MAVGSAYWLHPLTSLLIADTISCNPTSLFTTIHSKLQWEKTIVAMIHIPVCILELRTLYPLAYYDLADFSYMQHLCNRRSVIVSCTSTALSLVAVILICTKSFNSFDNVEISQNSFQKHDVICIPNKFLSEDTFHQLKNYTHAEDDKICLESSEALSYFLIDILKSHGKKAAATNVEVAKSDKIMSPVSVHKLLLPVAETRLTSETKGNSDGNHHVSLALSTEITDPAAEHVRGAEVVKDGLLVSYTGIYFIYGNVNFKKSTAASKNKTLFCYIKRESPNRPWSSGVLMRTVTTQCVDCSDHEESSFAGGVFYLQAGDYIKMCVSDLKAVSFDAHSTYIGLALLTSNI